MVSKPIVQKNVFLKVAKLFLNVIFTLLLVRLQHFQDIGNWIENSVQILKSATNFT